MTSRITAQNTTGHSATGHQERAAEVGDRQAGVHPVA
jgi:hypothetical protein